MVVCRAAQESLVHTNGRKALKALPQPLPTLKLPCSYSSALPDLSKPL